MGSAPYTSVMTREATWMHAEVVKSFGELLAGWWFDGMHDTVWFTDISEQYNVNTLMDGARASNVDRIIAGVGMDGTEYMDYPAGESYGKTDANGNEFMNEYPSQPLGQQWAVSAVVPLDCAW